MAEKYIIKDQTLKMIGDAIRSKRGTDQLIKVKDMPNEILSIAIPDDIVLASVTIVPTGEEIIRVPEGEIGAFGMVTVAGDQNLIPENIKKGERIYGVVGELEMLDTSDATANPEDILEGKTAYVNGEKLVGTHICESGGDTPVDPDDPDEPRDVVLEDIEVTPDGSRQVIQPDDGVDGFSSVVINEEENLTPENIVRDVTIYGVTGTADTLSDAYLQEKQVTPTAEAVEIVPDEKFAGLSKVTVLGDAQLKGENIKSGVTIFGVSGELTTFDKPLTETTVTPTAKQQVLVPDTQHSGFSKITVVGDDNLIPANIRKGVTVFGVVGTNEGDENSPIISGDVVYESRSVELEDICVSETGGA